MVRDGPEASSLAVETVSSIAGSTSSGDGSAGADTDSGVAVGSGAISIEGCESSPIGSVSIALQRSNPGGNAVAITVSTTRSAGFSAIRKRLASSDASTSGETEA
jgi:hypothetical protein